MLYRPVIFVDYRNRYFIENLILNNIGDNKIHNRILDLLGGKIPLKKFIGEIPNKKSRFAFIECLVENNESLDSVKKFADRYSLDVLICNNLVEMEFRPRELNVDNLLNLSGSDLRRTIREEIALESGIFISNRKTANRLGLNRESSIGWIDSIVLDIDHDFEEYSELIFSFLKDDLSISNRMTLYRTANNRIRIYIGIDLEKKDAILIKNIYDMLNNLIRDNFGIDIDLSFKRLSQQVWLEEFRVLKKEGRRSYRINDSGETKEKWLSLRGLYNSLGTNSYTISKNARETKGESQSGDPSSSVPRELLNNLQFPSEFLKEIKKRKNPARWLKKLILNRFIGMAEHLKYECRSVILTLVGNAKFIDQMLEGEEDLRNDIRKITENIVELSREYSGYRDSIFGGKTFDQIFASVSVLPFHMDLGEKRQKPYHKTVLELFTVISSAELRKICNIKISEDGRTVTISANRLESALGFSHSSVCNLMEKLCQNDFCRMKEFSYLTGHTYEFAEKIDLDLVIEKTVAEVLSEDRDSFRKIVAEVKLNPFHTKIVEYLVSISKKIRFIKYMQKIYERFRLHFDDDIRVERIFRMHYHSVEPRYG